MISDEARKKYSQKLKESQERHDEESFANNTHICPKCAGDIQVIKYWFKPNILKCKDCGRSWYYQEPLSYDYMP